MSFKCSCSFLLLAVACSLLSTADARWGSFERQGNTEDAQGIKQAVLDTVMDKAKQKTDGQEWSWTDKPTGDSNGGDDSDQASRWQGDIKDALHGIGQHFKPHWQVDADGNAPNHPTEDEESKPKLPWGDKSAFPWGDKTEKPEPQQDEELPQSDEGADETDPTLTSGDDVSDSVLKGVLDLHNQYRARHGAPALSWSSSIASTAQAYSRRCIMQHSSNRYGENLAQGHRSFESAVQAWYAESSKYSYGNSGGSGTWHFTQIVWKSTTSLGCGYSACGGSPVYVCNYSPAANVLGAYSRNVSPPAN